MNTEKINYTDRKKYFGFTFSSDKEVVNHNYVMTNEHTLHKI